MAKAKAMVGEDERVTGITMHGTGQKSFLVYNKQHFSTTEYKTTNTDQNVGSSKHNSQSIREISEGWLHERLTY